MLIKVLGPGCAKCKEVEKVSVDEAIELLSRSNAILIKRTAIETRLRRLQSYDFRRQVVAIYEPTYSILPIR